MAWGKLVDLAMTPDDMEDAMPWMKEAPSGPQYPPGMNICLTHVELEKMKLDIADCQVNDSVEFRCFGTVKSIIENDGPDGPCSRVGIQIEKMGMTDDD